MSGSISPTPWVPQDRVPPGFWPRQDQFPAPLTPLFADFALGEHIPACIVSVREEYAWPSFARPQFLIVDGYAYTGTPAAPPASPSPEQLAAFEVKVRDRHDRTVVRRWFTTTRPSLLANEAAALALDLSRLTDAELLAHIWSCSAHATACYNASMANHYALGLALGHLETFGRAQFAWDEATFLLLLADLSPNAGRATVRQLDEVAMQALGDGALLAAVNGPEAWADATVQALLRPYLATYGHRVLEHEYATFTLAERPAEVVRRLRDAVARQVGRGAGAEARPEPARPSVVAGLRDRLGPVALQESFQELIDDSHMAYQAREECRGFQEGAMGLMRYALLEAGRRFTAQGLLRESMLVFYLRRPELEDALRGAAPQDVSENVLTRAAEHARQRETTPPSVFGTPPPTALPPLSDEARAAFTAVGQYLRRVFAAEPATTAQASPELRGVAAAPGTYCGPARVVLEEDQFARVQQGDVLVCPITTPIWGVLFGTVGALVTNRGGMLSHAATTAREFGIPAVVGTGTATASIHDGQLIEVDGTAGVVRLL